MTMMDDRKCKDCIYFRRTEWNVGICQDREAYVGGNKTACGWYCARVKEDEK